MLTGARKAHIDVPEDVMGRVNTMVAEIAPTGMDRTIIEKAVRAVATRQGETFRDKQITGLKSLGQGRAGGREGKELGEMVSVVAINARQQTEATISLSTEALWTARITAGNAAEINPESKEVQKCILAILQRTFTSEHFKLSLLVAQIPGTPPATELNSAFGEANDCLFNAKTIKHMTADDDRKYYTYLQRAMQALQVVVTPDLDVGFATGVRWFAEGITNFVANGTPMCLVTRAISRFLLQAQRQRKQELMFADESGEEMLSFKSTEELTNAKRRLLEWNRDAQVDQQIQWARCFEHANANNAAGNGSSHGKPKVRFGGETSYGRGGSSSAGGRSDNGTDGPAPRTKHEGMEINFHSIDRKKWDHHYGEIRIGGKVVMLCWYHCNRPGGCIRDTDCTRDHRQYPTAYKTKPLIKCVATFQKEVLAKCART